MKKILFYTVMLFLLANPVFADHSADHILVEPNQIKVEVKGVVCSFCAYGAHKNLKKLSFLDDSQFKDGVHVDIHAQMITLALSEDQPVILKEIYDSIKKGGYEPVVFYVNVKGQTVEIDSQQVSVIGHQSLEAVLEQM